MSVRPLALALGTSVAAACATSAPAPTPTPVRACAPLAASLPPLSAVVDSQVAAAALAPLLASRDTLVLSLHFEPDGTPRAAYALGPTGPALDAGIRAALRHLPAGQRVAAVRLVASRPVASLSLAPSEFCRPFMATASRGRPSGRSSFPPGAVRYRHLLGISAEGTVTSVTKLAGGGSVPQQVEASMQEQYWMRSYRPARIDGIPVASTDTVESAVTMQLRRSP